MNIYHRKQAALAERRRLATEAAAKIRADREAAKLTAVTLDYSMIGRNPLDLSESKEPLAYYPDSAEFDEAEESGEELAVSEDSPGDSADPVVNGEEQTKPAKRKRGRKKKQ